MRSNAVLLALAIGATLNMSGCANTATSGDSTAQEAASADQAKEAETFCQTDEDTGSRLAHRTTCANTNSTDAQQAGRALQKGN
ncbi:hypothetical protein [Nevskia soli]|uniref:hypothetical protein n=1 Tax=Nevskia soli TaxID=418856 RepID=UPI0004A6BE2D|nr:hypothetical protein [Nevskia soli]